MKGHKKEKGREKKSVEEEDKEKGKRRNVLLVKPGQMQPQRGRGWGDHGPGRPCHPQISILAVAVL